MDNDVVFNNRIIFPTLKSISIIDYSLYKEDIHYDFIDGINLVIGGNGMGKTTFINILKYALIGGYRTHTRFERTYKEKRIIKRRALHGDYFKNRMKAYGIKPSAKVLVTFRIGDSQLEVVRSLYEHKLLEFRLIQKNSSQNENGEVLPQADYDELFNKFNGTNSTNGYDEKTSKDSFDVRRFRESIQYKYEECVKDLTNLPSFDAFIFFIINIFVFDESRSTIFWEEKNNADLTIQEYLTLYLLTDISIEIEKHSHDKKYFDSRIRHLSEDRKPLRKLLEDMNKTGTNSSANVSELREKKLSYIEKSKEIDGKRNILENQRKILSSELEKTMIECGEIEAQIQKYRSERDRKIFSKLDPRYHTYLKYIEEKKLCPFCMQDIDESLATQQKHLMNCFYCDSVIQKQYEVAPKNIELLIQNKAKLDQNIVATRDKKQQTKKQLEALDNQTKDIETRLFKLNLEIRNLEHSRINDGSFGEISDNNYIVERIKKIEKERNLYITKKEETQAKLDKLNEDIRDKKIRLTEDLSKLFTTYAEKFLPYSCYLKFDKSVYNPNYESYIPVIDEIPRNSSDELSESQSFFMEQSFRLSFLDVFYVNPTMFIFETPDSSLDIAYSQQAAESLIHFLRHSNSLIVTFNYGNSDFLNHIKKKLPKHRIKTLDMMFYGRQSITQINSKALHDARETFMENIDEQ